MYEYKVVMLGSGGVGKSSLVLQFASQEPRAFRGKHEPTFEDYYRKVIIVDASHCALEILDIGGAAQQSLLRDMYIRDGDGFVVVFSIASLQTYRDIQTMREQIQGVKGRGEEEEPGQIPLVLVGNKQDLATQREVPMGDGFCLAQKWGCNYLEASAKSENNVDEVFFEIVREINSVPEKVQKLKGCCKIF